MPTHLVHSASPAIYVSGELGLEVTKTLVCQLFVWLVFPPAGDGHIGRSFKVHLENFEAEAYVGDAGLT